MENPTILDSKKPFAKSTSSFIEPNNIEITHDISEPKLPDQNLIVGNEIAAVDEDNHDDAVIIAEKDASNGNGKKLMLNNLAGHEVNTIDGVIPSPKTNEIVEEATVPSLSASTNEKHAVPASSSLLSGTQTNSKVNGSKENNPKPTKSLFKSLFSKSFFSKSASCFGSKLPSFRHRATSIKMHESSSASATEQPSSSAGNLGDTASATEQPSSNAGNLGDTVSATQQPSLSAGSGYFDDDEELKLDDLLSTSAESSSSSSKDSILNKLKLFKKFDILDDHLDHFYESSDDCSNPPNNWVKSVADEWKMLEKDLPDTIYVRVYEGRMDLLRAVMVGADGTPYHDGLFFFDVHFPAFYPKCPPAVKYHSHGLRINPNLYGCGRVCLSLLGTWAGTENENWRPFKSNMLQVLVSIQGLILTAEPYVNEPFITLRNIDYFVAYREHVYIKSLKTMLYTLKNPPKYFEDLVYGHFYLRAHDILEACRAYLKGVEVGRFVKNTSQKTAPKKRNGHCSDMIKRVLPSYNNALVGAFTRIGVKGCEKYLISEAD